MNPYCAYCLAHPQDLLNRTYHDTEYGFPLREDEALFERFALEINQAGLSWNLMLKKREGFRRAYQHFSIERVAAYGEEDRARLLDDPEIIRNRLKVNAVIENARRLQVLRAEHGSFYAWLRSQGELPKEAWVRLFRQTFVFTGGEIVGEFLLSTGFLPGAHSSDCPVYPLQQAALRG